jgi:hypothetical protein
LPRNWCIGLKRTIGLVFVETRRKKKKKSNEKSNERCIQSHARSISCRLGTSDTLETSKNRSPSIHSVRTRDSGTSKGIPVKLADFTRFSRKIHARQPFRDVSKIIVFNSSNQPSLTVRQFIIPKRDIDAKYPQKLTFKSARTPGKFKKHVGHAAMLP